MGDIYLIFLIIFDSKSTNFNSFVDKTKKGWRNWLDDWFSTPLYCISVLL
jgi:hypothetical protein